MRKVLSCAVAGLLTLGGARAAQADEGAVPPPEGTALVLAVGADGVQIYACEANGKGFAWVFKDPEAALFDDDGRQIGTHSAGPTWKASDGSTVVGEVVATADAPDGDAIPWLLLRAKSHQGSGILRDVTYIRRSETTGGVAPETGCDASHVAEQARMRYSATYEFFRAEK